MALSFGKKNNARGSIGLDVDGSFLAAAQVVEGKVTLAASADLAPGLIREGEVSDPGGLSDSLRDFFRDHELPKNVRLGVSNQQIVVRHLELPRIENAKELDAAVRFQAADAIAMPLDDAVIDYQVVGEVISPEGTARSRVIVVAARQGMIQGLVDAVKGAGLKPEGIDLNAFALVRALAETNASDEIARVYCHLGGITNLAIGLGSTCLFTRPLSAGLDHGGEQPAAALAEEIRLSIDFYMAQPDARPAGDVMLSGPGSKAEGLADELTALIGLPVTVAEPLGQLNGEDLPVGEDAHRHTVSAGLALGATA